MISDSITQAYSQEGGDLPFFVGKQYGSGWLRTLARIAFPILKRVVRVAGRTADDVINKEQNWKTSLKDHALEEVGDAVGTTINRVGRHVSGTRKRKRNHTSVPPLLKRSRK